MHLIKPIRKAHRRGAKVVVVDPKRVRIADEAGLHLPIVPGTDVVLGYAVAAALERRGAIDREFVDAHVTDADREHRAAGCGSLRRVGAVSREPGGTGAGWSAQR